MTADLDQQVDPYGNDAGDDHREAWCEGCGEQHHPGEHRALTAPELAVLRAAVQLTVAGAAYTDAYLTYRAVTARGIQSSTDNHRAYRHHVETLRLMGYLEDVDITTTPLGVQGTPVDATTAAIEHLISTDRSNR